MHGTQQAEKIVIITIIIIIIIIIIVIKMIINRINRGYETVVGGKRL